MNTIEQTYLRLSVDKADYLITVYYRDRAGRIKRKELEITVSEVIYNNKYSIHLPITIEIKNHIFSRNLNWVLEQVNESIYEYNSNQGEK